MSEPDGAGAPADDRLKFLVVASDCPEARLAAYFTARRAKRSNARVILLHVIEPADFGHWATVAETMRAEAYEHAEAILAEFSAEVEAQWGEKPETVIREGRMVDEIRKTIEGDAKIAILFLGASTNPEGPGPLVSALAHKPAYLGGRPIPVTVVPGSVSRDDLREMSG
ncbi:MAG: universal stress protein [Parvularculaceae bacterium]